MNSFERLVNEACEDGIEVVEYPFKSDRIKGLYCDNTVALSSKLHTNAEKNSILAEELGHHYTSSGDITGQNVTDQKQEHLARLWGYDKLIGLRGIVDAYKHGCTTVHEMAEYLEVTEKFLNEALDRYRSKYSPYATIDNYIIYFEPYLGIFEML